MKKHTQLSTLGYVVALLLLLFGTNVFGQAGSISAPSNLVITPGNTSVSVKFDVGTVTNTTLSSVEYSLGTVTGTTTWTGTTTSTVAGTTSGTFTATVQGLESGTTYTMNIRVVGTNTTTVSNHTTFQFTTTALTAPLDLEAVSGNRRLTIQFTPPDDDGGNAIKSYQYTTNNGTNWKTVLLTAVTAVTDEPTRRQFTFATLSSSADSLVNGTKYSVFVRAVNDNGVGETSEEVEGTPATVPTAPLITLLTPTNDGFTVAFNAPTTNGGNTISNYQYSVDNGTTWSTSSPTVTTSPLTIKGLQQGTLYRVRLRAVNEVGSGASSLSTQATTHTLSAPTNLEGSVTGTTVTVTFEEPELKSAGAITNYEYTLNDGSTWISAGVATTTFTITGLTNGTTYTAKLRAVNAGGKGLTSAGLVFTPRDNSTVASVQLFHNANIGEVDVLVDADTLVDGFDYQTATEFLTVLAAEEVVIKLVRGASTLGTLTTTFTPGSTYQVFVVGGSSGKAVEFVVTDLVKTSTQANQVEFRFLHGITSTEKVTLERVTNSTPRQSVQLIALNENYKGISTYLRTSDLGFTTLQLTSNGEVLGRFLFNLGGLEGKVITFVGTGVVGSTLNVLGFDVNGDKLPSTITTSDEDVKADIPTNFVLYSNFPNPFNPTTNIRFDLPEQANVKIQVVDVLGRQVMEVSEGRMSAGVKTVTLNGSKLSSGVYYYKVVAEGQTKTYSQSSKFTLVK
jgi:hypothetical protein